MHEIVVREELAQGTMIKQVIVAPRIAAKGNAGQFIILRVNDTGERIPLTLADIDRAAGTITLVYQIVGKTTALLASMKVGQFIKDICGPLGEPEHLASNSTVVCIGGGTGIAVIHHITKALSERKNYVITILGARTYDLIILEEEMRQYSNELHITTDDGSSGLHGFVTDALQKVTTERNDINIVYAIGPIPMMKNVCKMTKAFGIPTKVSLNPIMIDGTGMCGGCRVTVDGKTKFCCVDGPHFDGHKVDWDTITLRRNIFLRKEKISVLSSISNVRY